MLCQITKSMDMRWFKAKKRAAAQVEGFGGVQVEGLGGVQVEGFEGVQASPASIDNPKNVVVVMDGMRGFTIETIQSALETNIIPAGCTFTLLGVMPWPNVPLSSKSWFDVWTVELDDATEENEEWMGNFRYLKLKAFVDLCRKHGVVPQKETAIGHNRRLRVVEKISGLHATWVIFDRHQKKNIDFYAQRIPCKMVFLNEHGEANMIKDQPCIDTPNVAPFSSRC